MKRIKNLSKLMYRIKKESLLDFVKDQANMFLLRYFAENEGLAATAAPGTKKRPACR